MNRKYYYYYYYYYYYIDRLIYLSFSKSTHSAAGQKALKPAANGRYLMCKSLPYYFHLLYRSTFILLSVSAKCMLSLRVAVIHRTLTWTTGSLTCIHCDACVYTWEWGTPKMSQHNILTRKNSC